MARDLGLMMLCAIVAVFLGWGYYDAFRSGVLKVKGRTSRRDFEPIRYWFGMLAGAFAFLVMVSLTVPMAFFFYRELYGR